MGLALTVWGFVGCGGSLEWGDHFVSKSRDQSFSQTTQNSMGSSIINGELVASDEGLSRSIVALVLRRGDLVRAFCTATILSDKLAITAAHCSDVFSRAKVELMFGLAEKNQLAEFRPLVQFVVHKDYIGLRSHGDLERSRPERQLATTSNSSIEALQSHLAQIKEVFGEDHNDLALLKFEGGLPPGYAAAKVSRGDQISDLSRITLAGFGVTNGQSEAESESGQLRKTEVPIAKLDYSSSEFITDESLSGSCRGDSGGPAFFQTLGGEIELVGVTSRGDEKCRFLGIYTYLPAFLSWLNQASQALGVDPVVRM
jgi:secreted trypsin-like serine protease